MSRSVVNVMAAGPKAVGNCALRTARPTSRPDISYGNRSKCPKATHRGLSFSNRANKKPSPRLLRTVKSGCKANGGLEIYLAEERLGQSYKQSGRSCDRPDP